jgi:hypothetical protein
MTGKSCREAFFDAHAPIRVESVSTKDTIRP